MNFKLIHTTEVFLIEYRQKSYTLEKTIFEKGEISHIVYDNKGKILETDEVEKIIKTFEYERDM